MAVSSMVLAEINIYPLKSARAVSLSCSWVGAMGPEFDRRWMLVDEAGRFVTQRRYGYMALINVALTETGLQFSAPEMLPLSVARPQGSDRRQDSTRRKVTVWQDVCEAIDAGDVPADWFSRFLGVSCRLVYMPEDEFRPVDSHYLARPQQVSFTDGFPFVLISEASLVDLNRRLEQPVSMQRFRPNLVVAGCEPYAEDEWRLIRIGDIEFDVVKPCSRCVITTIDPNTGEKGAEPLTTLMGYRKNDYGVCFGQNLVQRGSGILRVGDPVRLIR